MRAVSLLLVVVWVFVFYAPVSADIAPPEQPPGYNPVPGNEATRVRMEAEIVTITVQAETSASDLAAARVTANFSMVNTGTADETMAVRFPLGTGDEYYGVKPISNIMVKVDGALAAVRQVIDEDPSGYQREMPWIEFDVTFPVGVEVPITVSYDLKATGEMPYVWFSYIFFTGAGWYDTIGSAELNVVFPYEVNDIFILHCIASDFGCTTPGGKINGRQITWLFQDFEPDDAARFTIAFTAPSVWQKVLKEEARVAVVPGDGEAWGRLGRLYKSLIFSPHGWRGFRNYYYLADPGVEQLFQLADQAYTQAVTLLPEDPLWHAGYAELLGYYASFAGYEGVDTLPLKIKALEELRRALELAPEDETVREIAYGLTWPLEEGLVDNGGSFDFPWLTATPVPTARTVETTPLPQAGTPTVVIVPEMVTIVPTSTEAVIDSEPTAAPVSGGGGVPLCGGTLALPFIALVALRKFR